MSGTQNVARYLRDLAREALAAPRLESLKLPTAGEPLAFVFEGVTAPVLCERRGDAFAASVELDDNFDDAVTQLAQLGKPERSGVDPAGVRWAAYRTGQSFGVLVLVERDGAAVLHLEPFNRAKPFTGLEPDVASWFAARSTATSRPAAEVAAANEARRALRKATKRPAQGRMSGPKVKQLAGWFSELAAAPLDRAAVDRFVISHGFVLDDDHQFAGRTYLVPSLATRLHVDIGFSHVMTILGENEGDSGTIDWRRTAAHDARHGAIRTDVIAALGEPTAEGVYRRISTETWAVWRRPEAVIALITGMDPRGDGGHATALRMIAWPSGKPLPEFEAGPVDWIDKQARAARR